MNKDTIPIFYACDDTFVKFTVVSMRSLIDNASKDRNYRIYILNNGISEKGASRLAELSCDNVEVILKDVGDYLEKISGSLPIRDYYSKTT
ncbi:MAG: hypothetical protein IJQ80_02125, partial [Clostridia bacterium]|nr:hypothetical protein [Clostridia bacterium]